MQICKHSETMSQVNGTAFTPSNLGRPQRSGERVAGEVAAKRRGRSLRAEGVPGEESEASGAAYAAWASERSELQAAASERSELQAAASAQYYKCEPPPGDVCRGYLQNIDGTT